MIWRRNFGLAIGTIVKIIRDEYRFIAVIGKIWRNIVKIQMLEEAIYEQRV